MDNVLLNSAIQGSVALGTMGLMLKYFMKVVAEKEVQIEKNIERFIAMNEKSTWVLDKASQTLDTIIEKSSSEHTEHKTLLISYHDKVDRLMISPSQR